MDLNLCSPHLQRLQGTHPSPLLPCGPAWKFQILEFVLYAPWKTRLHNSALSIIAMHASPFIAIPRIRIIAVSTLTCTLVTLTCTVSTLSCTVITLN